MNLKTKCAFFGLVFTSFFSHGQSEQYNYRRQLEGITENWHTITLENDLFSKVSFDLSDIRIIGLTDQNDTIEAPYLLHKASEKTSKRDVKFKLINQSHTKNGYYFTFEIPTDESVNEIKLNIGTQNFDWLLKLEGSQNQSEWFTILEDYRILSIKNELSNFSFTKVAFPSTKYQYLRLLIGSNKKPDLKSAQISLNEIVEGNFNTFEIKTQKDFENKKKKLSGINIDLGTPLPISRFKIAIKEEYDYYRPITIKYLSDSIKTEKGWKYSYRTLSTGTLNSFEKNELNFESTILQKLKILVYNGDNQPLTIDKIEIQGYIHQLVARFTEEANYFLIYGNRKAKKPQYDIARFSNKIPEQRPVLSLGDEEKIAKISSPTVDPLFMSKTYLWLIMGLIILVLGGFSIKMLRKS